MDHRKVVDKTLSDIRERLGMKYGRFNHMIVDDGDVCNTIVSGSEYYRMTDAKKFTDLDDISVQTFPVDYDFKKTGACYVCGMSVPPVMMANIAAEIYEQWLE